MTTKIEITITENNDVVFIYMYKEKTLINKFEIAKDILPGKSNILIKNICSGLSHSLQRIIESLIKGGD